MERLSEEFASDVIATTPTVPYILELPRDMLKADELRSLEAGAGAKMLRLPGDAAGDDGESEIVRIVIEKPGDYDQYEGRIQGSRGRGSRTLEPMVEGTLVCPEEYVGSLIQLCETSRGEQLEISYLGEQAGALIRYRLPLVEVISEFFDSLKSISKGYASFDYEASGHNEVDVVKMDILLNGDAVDSLSSLVDRPRAELRGREIAERLSKLLARQQFPIAIQAAVGAKILARATIKAYRKDVLTKVGLFCAVL
jgi:translation elongation factor EF-4